MASWRRKVLSRVRELGRQGKVRFTLKALRESIRAGLDFDDVVEIIAQVTAEDLEGRLSSTNTGEWLYIFKPRLAQAILYIKVAIRNDCIVLSCHEDQEEVDHARD